MSLARGAGILCNNPDFRAFLSGYLSECVDSPKKAAVAVRTLCQINSRAELDINPEAAQMWHLLVSEFNREKGK